MEGVSEGVGVNEHIFLSNCYLQMSLRQGKSAQVVNIRLTHTLKILHLLTTTHKVACTRLLKDIDIKAFS